MRRMRLLSGSQTRQLVDSEQLYLAFRASQTEYDRRFKGSMSWKTVSGRAYLYRKGNGIWKSLGPRSPETERIYESFHEGRTTLKARRKKLDAAIRTAAPVNVAMRLGRVPFMSARILRRIDRAGLLGHGLRVVGTHALYAYERLSGGHFHSDIVATLDIDLLYDVRSRLRLSTSELADQGLIGLLRSLDSSFTSTGEGSFRAANDTGFLVDLIAPPSWSRSIEGMKSPFGHTDDLRPVEITGLDWLQNNPVIEATVIDEKGYPLSIVAPDPRIFAIHKLWMSQRDDRDPAKRRRDAAQSSAVAQMLVTHLSHMAFDDPALNLSAEIRKLGQRVNDQAMALSIQEIRNATEDWG